MLVACVRKKWKSLIGIAVRHEKYPVWCLQDILYWVFRGFYQLHLSAARTLPPDRLRNTSGSHAKFFGYQVMLLSTRLFLRSKDFRIGLTFCFKLGHTITHTSAVSCSSSYNRETLTVCHLLYGFCFYRHAGAINLSRFRCSSYVED
jgi:hypothetical protein